MLIMRCLRVASFGAILLGSAFGQSPIAATCDVPVHSQRRPIRLSPIVTGFERPTSVTHAGDGSGRLFVTEIKGRVLIVENGQINPEPFLDISDLVDSTPATEKGLFALAFHPDYPNNRRLFVTYSDASSPETILAEYRVDESDPKRAMPEGRILLTIPQYGDNRVHKGGQLMFGPDGYLYLAAGDGQNMDLAQDLTTLTGTISRIDVDQADSYSVPSDNPFFSREGARPEIWAYGFRNPWRFSFDACTGRLFVGDVGPNDYEEINIVEPGGNYGWPIVSGESCFRTEPCAPERFATPMHSLGHIAIDPEGGNAVIGGFVYRGAEYPSLAGRYIFADFTTGAFWSATETTGADVAGEFQYWLIEEIARTTDKPVSFGQAEDGALLLVGLDTLYEIVPERLSFSDVLSGGASFLDPTLRDEDVFSSDNWSPIIVAPIGEYRRWGKGPQSTIRFELDQDQLLSLNLQIRSPIEDQAVTITHNGNHVASYSGPNIYDTWFEAVEILFGATGTNTLTITYQDWNGNNTQFLDNIDRPLAVQFNSLQLAPAPVFGGGSLMDLDSIEGATLSRFSNASSNGRGILSRWGIGPSSSVEFNLNQDRDFLINFSFRSPVESQEVTVEVNGEIIASLDGDFSSWREETLRARGRAGKNVVVFHYKGWNGNPTHFRPPEDVRKLAGRVRDLTFTFVEDQPGGDEDTGVGALQSTSEVLGDTVYQNCVGCHQPTGLGVPGIFPKLTAHAADLYNTQGGRDYLMKVVLYGVQGEVLIEDTLYNGEMPNWAHLSNAEIAAVLNYILTSWGNDELLEDYVPITFEEIEVMRRTPLGANEVYQTRQLLPSRAPE